ncbi:lipopolysaccharide biosynthesis protein [Acinetobacter populi]|uniref:Lipopolysaccharide biosynthesis protein n=1 Tax=Acinetobacter populi TaxID=1582270 RepID=A0A1Z9Z2I0_9GAMM|nr:lipopolysaccharide biosynthesis protein [Acinetobacter populi]OUY08671.1 lipopolysaccharide biosynthesis protein [Acinetobacter populi]
MNNFFTNTLFRNIFKYLYKISHTKKFNHNRRYWPYFRVERDKHGLLKKVFYKNILIADNTVIAEHQNNTCMIIATGPSIKTIESTSFQNDRIDYLGLNGAISLSHTQFKYYIVIDHDFVINKFNLILKILENTECIFFTTPRCLEIILRKYDIKNIKAHLKVIETITENKLERFMGSKIMIDNTEPHTYMKNNIGFSTELFHAVYDYYTVAYVALQIAYALNYKKILIAGLDMNNFDSPRFYESNDNKQPTRLKQDFEAISQAFNVAADFFKDHNIEVYNLSPNSAIKVFKKTDLKSYIFKNL